jgi:hypothetical protein
MTSRRCREKERAVLDVWICRRSFRGDPEDGIAPGFLELRAKTLQAGRYIPHAGWRNQYAQEM